MLLDLQTFVITKHTAIAPEYLAPVQIYNTTNWILANFKISSLNNCLLWYHCLAFTGSKRVSMFLNILSKKMQYYFTLQSDMKNSDATFSHCNCYSTKNPPESNFKTKTDEFLALAISLTMLINKLNFNICVTQQIRLWITDLCSLKIYFFLHMRLINYGHFQ